MKNAKELISEFVTLACLAPKEAAGLFTEDGVFEIPYIPCRYVGREQIAGFLQTVRDLYLCLQFEKISVLTETAVQAFAEYEVTAVSNKTNRAIHQLFFARLVAEKGEIKLFSEVLEHM